MKLDQYKKYNSFINISIKNQKEKQKIKQKIIN